MMMSRILSLAIAGVVVGLAAGAADAKQYKFVGGHPIEGGFCHIGAPHVHVFAPAKAKLSYRVHDGHHAFVGDPVAHGYDGEHHGYYGHHPIAVDVVAGVAVDGAPHHIEYCYLDGPHFHAYAPPADLKFEVKGGVYWYVDAYPPEYERDRPALVKINGLYADVDYARPVVEVEPPALYVGPIVRVHAAVPAVVVDAPPPPHAEVRAGIAVDVHVPTPTLEVGIGLPGVVVVEEHHHHDVRVKRHKVKSKHWKRKQHKRWKHDD
jgi:hypothetical protein